MRRIHLLIAAALLALAWLGWRWQRGDGDRAEAGDAEPTPAATRHFAGGQWVERDADELARALAHVRLRSGLVRVAGVVREYPTRAPIPGAEVVLADPLGESSAWTDDQGRYEMFVRPGGYRAFARADGYVAVGVAAIERVPSLPDASEIGLPRGQIAPLVRVDRSRAGIDLQLAGAATVYGTVYDASGRPIAGALVSAGRNDALRPIQGTHLDETDLDGSYRLLVPAGHTAIDAAHLDYAGAGGGAARYLQPGEEQRIDLTLSAGCIITGTAVDAGGQRVSEGSLERWIGGAPPNDYRPAARIDADGDFRLALTETGRVQLRAWPWKSGPSQPRVFDCYDGATYAGVRFVTQDLDADLEGTIYDVGGQPLERAYIDVLPLDAGGMAQQERADAYGDWAFYALPPGFYHVKAYVAGKGVAAELVEVPARGLRLRLGGTGALAGRVSGLEHGSFTLTVQSCVIDGEVAADFDDVTMPDLRVLVLVDAGQFYVDGLPACRIAGRAHTADGGDSFATTVTAGGVTPIDFNLAPH